MSDRIFEDWLVHQHREGMALAQASDILRLAAENQSPPRRYLAEFDCPTLVWRDNEVKASHGFAVAFQFPRDYLRVPLNPGRLVGLLAPADLFHPNVRFPFICTGAVAPGTSLVQLLFQVHEILSYQRLTPREDDALNREACAWARRNMQRFPLDTRPLKRRSPDFQIDAISSAEAP